MDDQRTDRDGGGMKFRKLLIGVTLVAAVLGGAAVVVSNGEDGMVSELILSVIIGIVCMPVAAVAAKLIERAAGSRWETSIRGLLVMVAVISVVLYVIVWQARLLPE